MTTRARAATSRAATRDLLIIKKNGDKLRITVPTTAKVTFAGVNPQQPGYGGHALRIYTTANNQLAVFTGVSEFRDLSLPVSVQKRTSKVKKQVTEFGDDIVSAEEYESSGEWTELEA